MSAIISQDGKYRYWLERNVARYAGTAQLGPLIEDPVVWVMCNPSTADAELDDATIRKCKRFTFNLGRSRLIVVNIFAFRSRHPRDLLTTMDPVGIGNVGYLRAACEVTGAFIIAAWGGVVPPKLRHLSSVCYDIIRENNRRIMCLGTTEKGDPRHPLMLSYQTPLVEYRHDEF